MSNTYKQYLEKYKELSLQNLPKKEFVKQLAKAFAEIWFSNKMVKHTKEYQKKYGFDSKEDDKAFSTHNNEADAFKHTFMQAWLTVHLGEEEAKKLGDMHENDGNNNEQPSGEENMDLWNNNQGREIGKEVWTTFSHKNGYDFGTIPYIKFNDIIAGKVYQRMKAGKLITHPDDPRRYVPKSKSGTTTGQAAPISNSNKPANVTQPSVKSENPKTTSQNFSDMIRQKYKAQQQENNKKFSKIFKTSTSGNGHWITMNGAHVFIED